MHDCQLDRETITPDRPRERLEALGPSALSDAELVALMLRTGNRGSSALAVATDLLARHGGLQGLSRVSGRELGRSQGIGPAKSASLRAALEVGRRLAGRRLRAGAHPTSTTTSTPACETQDRSTSS